MRLSREYGFEPSTRAKTFQYLGATVYHGNCRNLYRVRDASTDSLLTQARGQNVEIQHSHFVIMYIDDNGKLQIRTSDSIAGCGGAIFTPEVTDRFMEMTAPSPQSNTQFARE